ncbi:MULTISPECIES: SH3 domain-containing protein [Pseudoalteromonas]|uniref:SH3 domain-containing protein n=1 Tax=Pseudoalteromonas TaxID=53246 RepID=UPI001F15FBED|nr:SH3 domain-containing protein [Pseudoalteromonas sp. MMG024]MCF6458414.1 SH3 domain-containing protein [Pseudoalteromonas sp. MMG024]
MTKWLLLLALLFSFQTAAQSLKLAVKEPFLNIHSGAGRGYPIIYVAEKNETITVIKRHTSWYLISLENGQQGWAKQQELVETLTLDGKPFLVTDATLDAFENQTFSFGIALGQLEGVNSQSVNASWRFTRHLSSQLEYSYALGSVAKNQLVDLSVFHHPFPHWRFSPYLGIGAGQVWTTPKTPIIGGGDETRQSDLLSATVGLNTYITSRFVFKAEYKRFSALTERDVTEDLELWKLGITVFF